MKYKMAGAYYAAIWVFFCLFLAMAIVSLYLVLICPRVWFLGLVGISLPAMWGWHIFANRYIWLSNINIEPGGISVEYRGKIWFTSSWEELLDIGEFEWEAGYHYTATLKGMYFSKVPVTFNKKLFSNSNRRPPKGQAKAEMILVQNEKAHAEAKKYLTGKTIRRHGQVIWIDGIGM